MLNYVYVMHQLELCYRNSRSSMVIMAVVFCCHHCQRVEKGVGIVQVYPMNTLYPARTHSKTLEYAEQASRIGKSVQGVKGASLLTLLPRFDIRLFCSRVHALCIAGCCTSVCQPMARQF